MQMANQQGWGGPDTRHSVFLTGGGGAAAFSGHTERPRCSEESRGSPAVGSYVLGSINTDPFGAVEGASQKSAVLPEVT